MALSYFQEHACDIVIWETGLGGRLDATNIVTPLASIITNIQFDHQKYLGETLASIAFEKAGIIKPRVPVITGVVNPEAYAVIADTAARNNCTLTQVTAADASRPPLDTVQLPLLGRHQRSNAAIAVAAAKALQALIPVPEAALRTGLSNVNWPGRLQVIVRSSGQKVLLDGAHNPAGTAALCQSLQDYFPGTKPAMILGILKDKDWPTMCQMLAPLASRILLVPVHSERTAEPHGLAEVCHAANPAAPITECASLPGALRQCESDPFVTIAGSLYLIGEAMEILGVAAATTTGSGSTERLLNEWQPGKK
jgi:dihydrofolate synthase/folylpolyglutamate synthase